MTTDPVDDGSKNVLEMRYQTTVMSGKYWRSLGDYAKEQAAQLRQLEKKNVDEAKVLKKELQSHYGKGLAWLLNLLQFTRRKTFVLIGGDWVFLALLGIIMAFLSFTMDLGIYTCFTARLWIYNRFRIYPVLQFFTWFTLPVLLVLFATGFVFIVSPQATGSGISEMKTIMRGVVLTEYLTFRTLIAKTVGLTAALGSGMPLGKEGALVHIGGIVGTLLSKLQASFRGIYENESRKKTDLLATACAVGLSCSLGAPIGGVLFSIEVTSVYFAIRNYWRGFFSAVFGTLMFRLLAYWSNSEGTLTTVFPTSFQVDFPYDPHELFVFALVGVFGGLSGAVFVLFHRRYVLFMRNNKRISSFLKYNRFIYPSIVSVLIASLFYPSGFGRYLATTLSTKQQVGALFANFTWLSDDLSVEQADRLSHWDVANTNPFVGLGIFMSANFFLSILASTLAVPRGSLIPIFKVGAAFGRMIGEAMYLWFPEGILCGNLHSIIPGGYAIVGAAAFSAGVTHTISISIVVVEITGQIRHLIPILVAVIVSNVISTLLQPSIYESDIMIKQLPYLPCIISSRGGIHSIFVEDFMNRNVKYIWHGMTYGELKNLIEENQGIRSFPLLGDTEKRILLGSVQRVELIALLECHIGAERRLEAAANRYMEARKNEISQRKNSSSIVCRKVSRFEVTTFSDVTATVFSGIIGTRRSVEPETIKHNLSSDSLIVNVESDSDNQAQSGLSFKQGIGMSPEEREEWETNEMLKVVEFKKKMIDPAPYQLVERTSLHKVHAIFSLLGVQHTYVTALGKLVGIVSLTELRKAIENANSGVLS